MRGIESIMVGSIQMIAFEGTMGNDVSKQIDKIIKNVQADKVGLAIKNLEQLRLKLEGDKEKSPNQCTVCGETIKPRERNVRGAHVRCHKKVNRAINDGLITDDDAVEAGLFLPAQKGGRKFAEGDPVARLIEEVARRRNK